MQTLISTARATLTKRGVAESEIDRQWLLTAVNSIKSGVSYIADQKSKTNYDPLLVAAAYNAGGVYEQASEENRFKLKQFPIGSSEHCDRFIKWFNDFWSILEEVEIKPILSFWEYFHGDNETGGISLPLKIGNDLNPSVDSLSNYYVHTEQQFPGGYFPIGRSTTWHGGLHLLGNDGDTVHAVADGVVVCARMPAADSKQDSLAYGSRNFVLIQHGEGERVWYSLYYHLKSLEASSDEAKRLIWYAQEELKFSNLINLRDVPTSQNNTPIHEFHEGECASILEKRENGWYLVKTYKPNVTKNKGYVYLNEDRMEVVKRGAEVFESENVVRLFSTVKAKDVIGYLGEGITKEKDTVVKKPILHWTIMSPNLMPGFLETVDDDNDDFLCDSKTITELVETSVVDGERVFESDGALSFDELEKFFKDEERAKKIRSLACKFKSEWAINWADQEKIFAKAGLSSNTDVLSLYNFWDEVSEIDKNQPSNGHVWHYNPITFLYRQLFKSARANISADMFEVNKSFLLPKKAIAMLSGIGKYQSVNKINAVILVGHKGVSNDTLDAVELSKKRGESIGSILALDKDKYQQFIEDNEWGDRERKIMLSWFKKNDGKPYYEGSIEEDNAPSLKAAVESFQIANGLTKDGFAGKNTFAKMYELIHKMANLKKFDNVEVIGAGEVHAEAKWKHAGCVVEAYFWLTEMAPSLEQYDTEADNAYKEWCACVREEIAPAEPGKIIIDCHYGGYELKKNDNDNTKKWGGETRDAVGSFVKELQEDLLRLGYWVSNPEDVSGKGMLCDKSFGKYTEYALKTFQFEHFVLDAEGNIDTSKKDKITGVLDAVTANKIKEKISSIGTKTWDRPGHKAHATWQAPPGTDTYTPNKTYNPTELFYQLPPSEGYYREGVEYGSSAVKTRTNKWRCTPFKIFDDDDADWLMADCWGKKSQIKLLKEIGDSWLKKEDGTPRTVANASGTQEQVKAFAIRDIGGFNGGPMHTHNTHQNGSGTDLGRASNNPMCNTPLFTSIYERNETYELSKILVEKGAKRVLFNCHYIIKNIEKAQQLSHHSDHIHFDGPSHDGNGPMLSGRYTSCNSCGIFSTCEERIFKVYHGGEWINYNSNNVYIPQNSSRGPGAVKLLNDSNQLLCKTQTEWLSDSGE